MTLTPTREHPSLTRVSVARPVGGGRSRVGLDATGPPDRPVLRPMLLSSDERGARVSLVPEGALLLAGDRVSVHVAVEAGAHLELVEPAGTVAYAMDGGHASWDVTIDLGPAATLVWSGEPFVVAEGAKVRRRTTVRLAWGARLALREVLVLGRHGEASGVLDQELTVLGPHDVPVLSEQLDVAPSTSRLLLGGARTMGTVLLVGERLDATDEGVRLDLEADGTVVRRLAGAAHDAVPHQAWAAARRATA